MRPLLLRRLPSLCAVALAALACSPAQGEEEGFVPLFNGKDLSGWVPVNTAPSTWTISEEGLLVCSGKPIGQLRAERIYQNFILELEWRHMVPRGNAGVFVWTDDITARGQPFHRGIEVQVLENAYGNTQNYTTHGDIFPIHGATMTPVNGRGGSRAFPTEERSRPSPEWNHYRIECRDGAISLAVNGKVVTQGLDCVPRKGYICLESEGGVVHYRGIRLKELPDTPVDPAHVAIADRGFRCLYTGVDLSGWQAAEGWTPRDWILSAAAGAAPLATEEEFGGDLGFIVDLRPAEGSGPHVLRVLGAEIALEPDLPGMGEAGQWTRVEGFLREGTLSLEINGQPQPRTWKSETSGRIALAPRGAADWANPYVRSLPAG